MYVEDRTSYNGPVQVTVKPSFTLAELKQHIQCEFEIPVGVQKWILGKSLAENDESTLSSYGISGSGQSIYLYLVTPKDEEQKESKLPEKLETAQATALDYRKGRYWNYEEDRWSYCEDSEDEEEPKKIVEKPQEKMEEKPEEDGDYEWEYFYEDAELKPQVPKNDPVEAKNGPFGALKEPNIEKAPKNEPVIAKKEAPAPGKTQRIDPRDGWECPSCTFLNEPNRPGCEVCTTERPKDYKIPPPGPLDTIPRGATAVVKEEVKKVETPKKADGKDNILNNYKKLDDLDIIPNAEQFECIICYLDIEPGDGVVLRECLHTFCK